MADLSSDNYYKILGINKTANEKTIKKAYRKLAVKYHPDKNQNDPKAAEVFKKINQAYSILSNKEKRNQYDTFGETSDRTSLSQEQAQQMFSSFFGSSGFPFMGVSNKFPQNVSFSFSQQGFPQGFQKGFQQGFPQGFQQRFQHGFPQQGFTTVDSIPKKFTRQKSFYGQKDFEKNLYYLKKNSQVIVKNLKKNPTYNNRVGLIHSYDIKKKRYRVKLNDKEYLSLLVDNLQQIQLVRIKGLTKKTELNNQIGRVVGFNNNRYLVLLKSKQAIALKKNNVRIQNEALVKICNLTQNKELNNFWALVKDYNPSQGKYTVQTENNKMLKIKENNLQI